MKLARISRILVTGLALSALPAAAQIIQLGGAQRTQAAPPQDAAGSARASAARKPSAAA